MGCFRPKYGTINLDVIDAVNARLAAVDAEDDNENRDVEANFNLPCSALRPQATVESSISLKKPRSGADKTRSNKSVTVSINRRGKKGLTSMNTGDTYAIADDVSATNPRTAMTMHSKWGGGIVSHLEKHK